MNNNKLIVIMGGMASGKNFVCQKLQELYNIPRIITYTTRDPRPNEEDGVDYHFISDYRFQALKEEGFFFEDADFLAYGQPRRWYYGSSIDEFLHSDKTYCIILSPSGVEMLLHNRSIRHKIVLVELKASTEELYKRLYTRGDDNDEISRRLLSDKRDFEEFWRINTGKYQLDGVHALYGDVDSNNIEFLEEYANE